MSSQKKSILVVGGGVAGLTAATTLIKHGGFDVTLLEADNRIGGRVQSLKLGDHYIENGAQWVHGQKNNSIFLKAEPLKLLNTISDNRKYKADSVFITQNGERLSKESHENFTVILKKILNGPKTTDFIDNPEKSVGEWAEKLFWEANGHVPIHPDNGINHAALDWIQRLQINIDGCDNWHISSCKGQQEYWECEGNALVAWQPPASYASLLNLILHDKPAFSPQFMPEIPSWIHLEKEVNKIDYHTDKVNVTCEDGSNFTCDHVICTVSLGVLKAKAKNLFEPSLPEEKLKAIEHLGIGCVDKLHFEFPSQWWPDQFIGFNLLWDNSETVKDHWKPNVDDETLKTEIDGFPLWCRSILGFHRVASHPTALNAWIMGPAARLVETLSEDEIKPIFIKVLRKFVGSLYDVPEPINFVRSTWYSNPFTRGSYSFRSVDTERHDVWSTQIGKPILKDNGYPIVCFAGEASHIHFYSTVHGAHDTGLREATRLINFYAGIPEPSQFFPFTAQMFEDDNE